MGKKGINLNLTIHAQSNLLRVSKSAQRVRPSTCTCTCKAVHEFYFVHIVRGLSYCHNLLHLRNKCKCSPKVTLY